MRRITNLTSQLITLSLRGKSGRLEHTEIPARTTANNGFIDIADEPEDIGPEARNHQLGGRISIVRVPAQTQEVKPVKIKGVKAGD